MESKIPSHVGIIMDGNGRWATARGKKRSFGHHAGSKNVDVIASHAFKCGIKTLTLYAFSSENWARPKEEVDELMKLLKSYLVKFVKKLLKNGESVSAVAEKCGFLDYTSFIRAFKRAVGISPGQYKKNDEE
jgi:undecaprenyl diphosphate synthase